MNTQAMTPDREFGWEDTIQNDSASGVLLPEGEYSFVVTAVERARHPGSAKLPPCNKAVLTLGLADEAGNAGQVKHNLFLHSKCEGLLCAFFLAIGLRQHGEPLRMRWDIIGRGGRCRVTQRSYTGNDGTERRTNDIAAFLEPPAAGPAAQPSPYPAGGMAQPQAAPAIPAPSIPAPAAQGYQAPQQTSMPLPRPNPWAQR